jgi:PleD family two-component response regulator
MLEKLGCKADAVSDGKEVLRAINEIPYDCILMDCHMPEMDGFAGSGKVFTIDLDDGAIGNLASTSLPWYGAAAAP